jgi:hypothetical protein
MRVLRHIVLLILCLPFNLIVGWPVVLFIRAAWGTNPRWEIAPTSGGLPALTCELKADSWPSRSWYKNWGATTLGHAIFYASGERVDGAWGTVQSHEHEHVEQFEGAMCGHAALGLLLFVALAWVDLGAAFAVGLTVWFLGYLVFLVGGWLGALLRGEPVYRGSAHEEAARSRVEAPDA